ncbi:MAG: 4Fe-4S single cluster domain-containing protein [Myxococcota bacterium]
MNTTLRVGHVVPDTEAEGPGRRFALWVQGCPLRCPGCCNPELFAASGGRPRTSADLAAEILATPDIEGLSVLGGEPFAQAPALVDVVGPVRAAGLSIMIFTGYTLAELRDRDEPAVAALLDLTDLLVDGRYQRERPESRRRWIGSSNQVMHFLSGRYSADDEQFYSDNTVEIRLGPDGLTVNGWPSAADAIAAALRRRSRSR